MSDQVIQVKNLSRKFGSFVAVDNISFSVKKGEIFGFLGANGAGKSTTIRMLCGLLNSSSGSAKVAGYDIDKEPEKVKANIGYMSQKFSLYDDLTIEENINFFGGIYGLSDIELAKRKKWALETADLKGKEKRLTGDLPIGWKQRLALVCALLHEPKIVFLDEPTGGVDPISRRHFWDLINSLSENGITIFVTTHYLDEAEYCNDIMLIQAGKLIAGGSPGELKRKYLTNPILEVECSDPLQAMDLLQGQKWIIEFSVFGANLHLNVLNEVAAIRNLRKLFSANKITLKNISRITPSLEDVFIHLIEGKKQGSSVKV
jgi:ABC-2 type transport system ATP-binding protein